MPRVHTVPSTRASLARLASGRAGEYGSTAAGQALVTPHDLPPLHSRQAAVASGAPYGRCGVRHDPPYQLPHTTPHRVLCRWEQREAHKQAGQDQASAVATGRDMVVCCGADGRVAGRQALPCRPQAAPPFFPEASCPCIHPSCSCSCSCQNKKSLPVRAAAASPDCPCLSWSLSLYTFCRSARSSSARGGGAPGGIGGIDVAVAGLVMGNQPQLQTQTRP